jgi:predicted transcriptional regulator
VAWRRLSVAPLAHTDVRRCPALDVYHVSGYTSPMARAVSVRLDDDVKQALNTLEASGMSRSEAIRRSILDAAAALRRKDALRAEVAALEADDDDRQEMHEVAALMESLRATR